MKVYLIIAATFHYVVANERTYSGRVYVPCIFFKYQLTFLNSLKRLDFLYNFRS